MKKIISGLLSVAVLFSVCGVCLASSETHSGTASEVAYITVNENTVKTSETVVYEASSIRSDLQSVNTDSEGMNRSSAGGARSKRQKVCEVLALILGGGMIFGAICMALLGEG